VNLKKALSRCSTSESEPKPDQRRARDATRERPKLPNNLKAKLDWLVELSSIRKLIHPSIHPVEKSLFATTDLRNYSIYQKYK